ncbi:MAG: alcohol dehydrogenase catalytic domain-containing protein [Eubacteriaceae bacterium]|nr:alcohol dehydrogenase catalytic domain-containing protein [Eubacteriaceae bacterium]
MKALVLEGKGQVSYKEVPKPECAPDGLLIKVDSVGLCGSDVRTYFHGHQDVHYPCILGHENAGTIVEVGSEVKGFKVNEKVIINPVLPCGKCWYCLKGWQHMCSDRLTYGHSIQGGFAEYMAVPGIGLERGQVLKIPEGVSTDEIVIVELLSSIVNSQDYANITLGETVVVIGTGPIGCLHSEVARLRGAQRIIMIDLNDERLEMSKKFSGTHFINSSKESAVEKVMEITDHFGADAVIIAAPSVKAQSEGLDMLRKRGRLVIFGGVSKDDPISKFDSNKIHYNEIAILGAFAYGPNDFKKAFDLVVNKMVKTEGFVTHVLPLEKMEEGVKEIQSGRALKVVLKP